MADQKQIKILVHADSPRAATGFGTVTRGIFQALARTGKYKIDIFGVNDSGLLDPDPVKYPYRIMPAMYPGVQDDFYGRIRFVNILRGADKFFKPSWDIVFTLNDPFIFEQPILTADIGMMDSIKDLSAVYHEKLGPEHWFKSVAYWPVDSYLKENWIAHAIGLPDYSVAYTDYGKKEIEKANMKMPKPMEFDLRTIYHGTNTTAFHPLPKNEVIEFKKKFFSKASIDPERTYIVGVVARNQMRKDLPRVMKIFKEFQRRRPESMLYIHAKENDVGGSLGEYARGFNMEVGKDWIFPGSFNEADGYPLEVLNQIYNCMDIQVQASNGEGWGLPITEAMAVNKLTLAPNITSIPEIFNTVGDNYEDVNRLADSNIRGIPIKAGSGLSEWTTFGPTDYERVRPLTNVEDAVKKLIWAYDHPDLAAKIAQRGYEWVQEYSWEKIANKWDEFFQEVYNNLEKERENAKEKTLNELKPADEIETPSEEK
jgi:glycosyltransferase involved in cell wall biosynthesis